MQIALACLVPWAYKRCALPLPRPFNKLPCVSSICKLIKASIAQFPWWLHHFGHVGAAVQLLPTSSMSRSLKPPGPP
jgi:hypothetical protein